MMKPTEGKVVIKIDLKQKEKYRFSNGQAIYISRGHNYNLREDNPNVAEVIDAAKIPAKSLCLIHHNATQDSYKIFEEKEDVFSIPEDMVFLYFENGEWKPNENFVISNRIFKPYNGFLIGIDHELVKNRMYIEKGLYEGNVVITSPYCDYEIVFFIDGVEQHIIRTRVRELFGLDKELSDAVKKGEYLVGINSKEAKIINNDTQKTAQNI